MKKDRIDRIEQVFREGLSDQALMSSSDFHVPDIVWTNIEQSLDGPDSNKRKILLGLLLLLFGLGTITGFSLYAASPLPTIQYLHTLPVPETTMSKVTSLAKFIDGPQDQMDDTPREGKEEIQSHITDQGFELNDQNVHQEGLKASIPNNLSNLQTLDRMSEKSEIADVREKSGALSVFSNDDVLFERPVDRKRITTLLPIGTRLNQLEDGEAQLESIEGQVKSSKYWTVQLGMGLRSNDYFIQGNFSIDPNTQFNVEKKWSPAVFATASYFMGKAFSIDIGLQYMPIRTTAKYAFTVPYSTAAENVVGNIAFQSISHNIPSVDGGLSAETRIERNIEAVVQDGDEIVLQADVEQSQKVISMPLTSRLRVLTMGNLHVNVGAGVNLNMQISNLRSEVVDLRSNREEINYQELLLAPLDSKSSKSFFAGYQFGLDAQYYFDNAGTFISGSINYANAMSPIFSFDNVNVYPRSWGIGLGIGKKF